MKKLDYYNQARMACFDYYSFSEINTFRFEDGLRDDDHTWTGVQRTVARECDSARIEKQIVPHYSEDPEFRYLNKRNQNSRQCNPSEQEKPKKESKNIIVSIN